MISPKGLAQTWTFFLPDSEATRALGQALGQVLQAGTVLLLEGNLGSGKTTLTQGIGVGLGITDAVVSPTFTLICEYLDGRIPLYHLDLYRLESAAVDQLRLETYWDAEEVEPGLMAIEWPDRLTHRPDRYLHLQLEDAQPEDAQPEDAPFAHQATERLGRRATLQAVGDWIFDGMKIQQMLAESRPHPGHPGQKPL